MLGLDVVKLCLQDNILDGVVAGWRQVGDGAPRLGRQHDVVLDEVVLLHNAVHVAARDVGADAQLPGLELPLLCHAENKRKSEIFVVENRGIPVGLGFFFSLKVKNSIPRNRVRQGL